jgi:pyocin large subunit-like protein
MRICLSAISDQISVVAVDSSLSANPVTIQTVRITTLDKLSAINARKHSAKIGLTVITARESSRGIDLTARAQRESDAHASIPSAKDMAANQICFS